MVLLLLVPNGPADTSPPRRR